jgi:Arm DNA-binding domain
MIGLREVRALGPNEIIWDNGKGAVPGFGARRRTGTAVVYIVKYRTANGRQRWQVIALLTPEEARAKAKAILGKVVDGADPAAEKRAARKAATVGELSTSILPTRKRAGC